MIDPITIDMNTRRNLVREALSWTGTPYRHQASLKGIGCDCLGFVRGLYRFLYETETEEPPPYSNNWAEAGRQELLLAAAGRLLVAKPKDEAAAGDVLVFRIRDKTPAKHCGILVDPDRFIHAVSGRGVATADFSHWWHRHLAGVFAFPGLDTTTQIRDA